MAKFTLLEIHLDDSTLTAHAPFSGEGAGADSSLAAGSDATTDEHESDADGVAGTAGDGAGGPNVVGLVAGLIAVAVVVAVLRRLIGGADREVEDGDAVDARGPDEEPTPA